MGAATPRPRPTTAPASGVSQPGGGGSSCRAAAQAATGQGVDVVPQHDPAKGSRETAVPAPDVCLRRWSPRRCHTAGVRLRPFQPCHVTGSRPQDRRRVGAQHLPQADGGRGTQAQRRTPCLRRFGRRTRAPGGHSRGAWVELSRLGRIAVERSPIVARPPCVHQRGVCVGGHVCNGSHRCECKICAVQCSPGGSACVCSG